MVDRISQAIFPKSDDSDDSDESSDIDPEDLRKLNEWLEKSVKRKRGGNKEQGGRNWFQS